VIRHPWKGISVLLTLSALVIASHGFAQQNNNPPEGLYAPPDSGQSTAQESASNRSAESYLNSLDPEGERYQRDLAKAEAARQAAASIRTLNDAAADSDSHSAPARLGLAQPAWIAILVGSGLLVSLAAVGYVWWSRIRFSRANAAVLLTIKPASAAKPDSVETDDKTPKRRAA